MLNIVSSKLIFMENRGQILSFETEQNSEMLKNRFLNITKSGSDENFFHFHSKSLISRINFRILKKYVFLIRVVNVRTEVKCLV